MQTIWYEIPGCAAMVRSPLRIPDKCSLFVSKQGRGAELTSDARNEFRARDYESDIISIGAARRSVEFRFQIPDKLHSSLVPR